MTLALNWLRDGAITKGLSLSVRPPRAPASTVRMRGRGKGLIRRLAASPRTASECRNCLPAVADANRELS